MKNRFFSLIAALLFILSTTACTYIQYPDIGPEAQTEVSLNDIPEYSGKPYVEINNNIPGFSDEDMTTESFEEYSRLDSLGRCGIAYANLGADTMPTEERGSIGMIKPSGWVTSTYDFIDGRYLYNRCHLIGFQLSGESANELNLITGTRYMNTEGMLPFENEVAEYIRDTDNHVLYCVTPIFEDNELLARGVHMEAMSVEDNGEGVSFNVYCYNVQPGIEIDYATGENRRAEIKTSGDVHEYILNTNSKKYHLPSCTGASQIGRNNKEEFTGTEDELTSLGYSPCGNCIGY